MNKEGNIRIGVLSDTHLACADENLKKIVDDHLSGVNLIFHAGDLIDLSVLDVFGNREVRAVCGNMDRYQVRQELPEQMVMEIKGFRIGLIHGWGSPEGLEKKIAEKMGNLDCIVFGHTHYPVNRVIDGIYFFNPGSAMDKRFAKTKSIGILEIGEDITGRIIPIE